MRTLLFTTLIFAALAASAGTIYRWVDAKGQVHYSESVPAGVDARPQDKLKAGSSSLAPRPTTAVVTSSDSAAAKTGKEAKTDKDAKADKDEAKAEMTAKANKEIKAKNCKADKERIDFLETNTARRIQIPQKDGSVARMTDEEFEKNLAEAKKNAASDCS